MEVYKYATKDYIVNKFASQDYVVYKYATKDYGVNKFASEDSAAVPFGQPGRCSRARRPRVAKTMMGKAGALSTCLPRKTMAGVSGLSGPPTELSIR